MRCWGGDAPTLHRNFSNWTIITITDVQALISWIDAHAPWGIEARVPPIAIHVSFRIRASEGSNRLCSVQCEKKKKKMTQESIKKKYKNEG